MEEEPISLPMEIATTENTEMESLMEKESILGLTDHTMKGNSRMGLNMAEGNGKSILYPIVIPLLVRKRLKDFNSTTISFTMRESIDLTRKMDKVTSFGLQEMFTKDSIRRTSVMAMVR